MIQVILRRLLIAVPMLFIISTATFLLLALVPGDPALAILGQDAPEEALVALRQQLGLDEPLAIRYLQWLGELARGDLGHSVRSGLPVVDVVLSRLPVTLSLAVLSLLVTAFVGIALGLLAALNGGVLGRGAQVVAVFGAALPNFWVGILLVLVFSVTLNWLPATGYIPPSQSVTGWVSTMILPVIAASLVGIAAVARQTRGAVADILSKDYIRTLLVVGTPTSRIIFKHVLRNAAIPVTITLSFQFIVIFSGAIVVERVFALPGLGQLMINAIGTRDVPVAQGIVVITAVFVLLVTLLVDIVNAWLNPKVRHA